jgi:DNA-binding CsgD family transcriptional regulator
LAIVTRLGHGDYHAALALVSEAAATHGAQPFERPTVESLLRVIPADRAGYFEYGGGGEVDGTANTFFVDEPACCVDTLDWATSEAVQTTISSWPLQDTCDLSRPPLKLSDFLTRRQLHRNPWYCEVMRPSGIEHELKLWLAAPAGTARGFFLVRGPRERDFEERDRSLLELLQPHLVHIRERWERRRRPSVLTDREAEVLGLVALGLTNGEIAARLVVSRTTVRTHLENIFGKLDVHTRTAAVARQRELAAHV